MTATDSAMAESSASARKQARKDELGRDSSGVPLALYGLRRGSVTIATALCILFGIFTIIPVVWIAINSTKDQANLLGSFGFWFARPFEFVHNFLLLFQNVDGEGVYFRWFANTVLYAIIGGVGSSILATLAGYGFARFRFRGVRALFLFVVAALLVPVAAITYPLYLVYARAGLINSIWGMILPSLVTPVAVYLMRVFVDASVPQDLIDAARVDGAGEVAIFVRIVMRLVTPGFVTVLLINIVAVWNNYFLPFIIFSKNNLYPLTVGLGVWATRAQNSGDERVFPLIVMGGFITIVPLIALFLVIQRYWKGGMLLGSIAG